MTPSPQEIAQVLEDAADIMLIRGRAIECLKKPDGSVCAIGALQAAADSDSNKLYIGAFGALRRHLGDDGPLLISTWSNTAPNDFVVIDGLRAAAKDLRNEASA